MGCGIYLRQEITDDRVCGLKHLMPGGRGPGNQTCPRHELNGIWRSYLALAFLQSAKFSNFMHGLVLGQRNKLSTFPRTRVVQYVPRLAVALEFYSQPPYNLGGDLWSALNGNQGSVTNSDDMSSERKGTRKKKTKEQKKEKRVKNNAQLSKQLAALKSAQANGLTKSDAAKLGRLLKGRGDYKESAIGRTLGEKAGGWIGNKLEALVRKIFGAGDYTLTGPNKGDINQNSLVVGSGVPSMHATTAGAIRVSFGEYLGDIAMTEDYSVVSYPIDPTNPNTFPWLSKIAGNFQQWQLMGAVFILKSLSSDVAIAPTQGLGSVFGAVRYDVNSQQPTSKAAILNSMFSSSSKPSQNIALPVECAREQTAQPILKILEQGTMPSDMQLYRIGWLDIATEGAANSYPSALELHVTYDIQLLKPKVDNAAGGRAYFCDLLGTDYSTPLKPIPDSVAVKQPRIDTIGLTTGSDYQTLYFPLSISTYSVWCVQFSCIGTTTSNVTFMSLSGGNGMNSATVLNDQQTYSYSCPASGTNTGVNNISLTFFFSYDGTGTTADPPYFLFQYAGSTLPSTIVGSNLLITEMNPILASGLTVHKSRMYQRSDFFLYLCDLHAGRKSQHVPPVGRGRLVDWVHQFKKTSEWPVEKMLPESGVVFDQTPLDALSTLSQYVDPTLVVGAVGGDSKYDSDDDKPIWKGSKLREPHPDSVGGYPRGHADEDDFSEWVRETTPPRPAVVPVRMRLNGNNGSFTNTDDHAAKLESEFQTMCSELGMVLVLWTSPMDIVNANGLVYMKYMETLKQLTPEHYLRMAEIIADYAYKHYMLKLSEHAQSNWPKPDYGDLEPVIIGISFYTSQLNGAQGSFTGTDDVDRESLVVSVNPQGLSGSLNAVHAVMSYRLHNGWKKAEFSMVKTSVPNAWLWLSPLPIMDRRMRASLPVGVWTIGKVRKVQCYCMTGEYCVHEPAECPARFEVVDSDAMEKEDGKKAVGECGAAAHKGDGPKDIPPCDNCHCTRAYHYHPKQSGGGAAVPKGGAQRVAMKKASQLQLCVYAAGSPTPLRDGVCVIDKPGKHYHLREEKLGDSSPPPPGEARFSQCVRFADEPYGRIQDMIDDSKGHVDVRALQVAVNAELKDGKEEKGQPDEYYVPSPKTRLNPNAIPFDYEGSKPLRVFIPNCAPSSSPPPANAMPLPPRAVAQPVVRPVVVVRRQLPNRPPPQPPRPPPGPPPGRPVFPFGGRPLPPPQPPPGRPNVPRLAAAAAAIGQPPPPPPPPPPPVVAAPPLVVAPAVAAIVDPVARHLRNLYNKANMLWLYKDPKSAIDQKIVVRSLATIARKDEIYEHIPDLGDRIVELVGRAGVDAVQSRIVGAERRLLCLRKQNMVTRMLHWLSQPPSRYWFSGDCQELDHKEGIEPHSLIVLTWIETAVLLSLGVSATCLIVYIMRKLSLKLNYFNPAIVTKFMSANKLSCAAEPKNVLPIVANNKLQMTIYACFGAPFVEEFAKRIYSIIFTTCFPQFKGSRADFLLRVYCGAAFGYIESLNNQKALNFVESRPMLIRRMCCHALFTAITLKRGILLHMLHNVSVTAAFDLQDILNPPSPQIPLSTSFGVSPTLITISSIAATLFYARVFRSHEFGQKINADICLDEYKVVPAATQPAFRIRYGEASCVEGHGATGSWGVAGFIGTTFRACHHNEKISLCGRVGKLLPAHINQARTQQITGNWRRLTPVIVNLFISLQVPFQYKPMNFEKWCHTFEPMRRDLLLQIARDGVDMPQLVAKSFIKKEIVIKEEHNPVFKDPRWIQGCPPELSARVGPYLRKWTHSFRDAIAPDWTIASMKKGKQVVYTCGMNAIEIGVAFTRAIDLITECLVPGERVVFFEDDESRFDLHLTEGPFVLLDAIYSQFLPRGIARLLRRRVSKGVSNLGTSYSVPYTMQSGWPDTSIGDTIVNAALKYKIHRVGHNWIAIICGDDSITITTNTEISALGGLDSIVETYEDYGMEIEAALREDPLDVEFCSGRFYPCGKTHVLMPRIGRMLSKICWDDKQRSLVNRMSWLRSIACTMREYGKIDPLLAALGRMLTGATGQGKIISTRDPYKYYVSGELRAIPSEFDVAVYYDHHYGLNSKDVAQLCSVIESSRVGDFLEDSRLGVMAEHDL